MQKDLNNTKMDVLLVKYITNDINTADKNSVEKWINNSSDNEQYFQEIKTVWQNNEYAKHFDQIDLNKHWNVVKSSIKKKPKKFTLYHLVKYAAAILLFGVMSYASYYYVYPSLIHKEIIAKEVKEINLPDGSYVLLHENSSIKYKRHFNNESRNLELKGKAFFDIAKEKNRPFVIHLNGAKVKVLGTSFRIDATKSNHVFVNVISGKVRFEDSNDKTNYLELKAGNRGIFDLDSHKMKLIPTLRKSINTKPDTLIFTQTPLIDVLDDFGNFFNKRFEVSNVDIKDLKLSSKFCNPSLADVLSELCMLYDLNCEIEKDTIYFYKD